MYIPPIINHFIHIKLKGEKKQKVVNYKHIYSTFQHTISKHFLCEVADVPKDYYHRSATSSNALLRFLPRGIALGFLWFDFLLLLLGAVGIRVRGGCMGVIGVEARTIVLYLKVLFGNSILVKNFFS